MAEMHKVNPEPQKGLSLELVEAALNVQLANYRAAAEYLEPTDFVQIYQAFIALRQAQAMEEGVEQLIRLNQGLNLGRLTARVEALESIIRETAAEFDPFQEDAQQSGNSSFEEHAMHGKVIMHPPDCSCAFCMPQEGDYYL